MRLRMSARTVGVTHVLFRVTGLTFPRCFWEASVMILLKRRTRSSMMVRGSESRIDESTSSAHAFQSTSLVFHITSIRIGWWTDEPMPSMGRHVHLLFRWLPHMEISGAVGSQPGRRSMRVGEPSFRTLMFFSIIQSSTSVPLSSLLLSHRRECALSPHMMELLAMGTISVAIQRLSKPGDDAGGQ